MGSYFKGFLISTGQPAVVGPVVVPGKQQDLRAYRHAVSHTPAVYAAMEREWLIGQQIDKLAAEDGDIPGVSAALSLSTAGCL